MADTQDIPAHRQEITPRSGDTHVIGEDGVAVNIDQQARDAAAAEEEAAAKKAAKKAPVNAAPEVDGKSDPVT